MTEEEFYAKIDKAMQSPRRPLDLEELRKKYLYPLKEAERKHRKSSQIFFYYLCIKQI